VRLLNPNAVVVYTSSSTVIGRAVGDVIDENHGERPLDIYSANKGAAEKYYRIYHRVHDLKTVTLRFANLYGPYGKGFSEFGFVNYFIGLAHADQEITVYGPGNQRRNVLYAEDAAEALYQAAQNPKLYGEAYFATHDEHVSVIDIATHIVRVFGRGKLTHVEWPEQRKRIEVDDVRISSALLRSLSTWRPRYSFLEGLERTRAIMEQK
jgi:UDP-glucose 4-epimerase